MAKQPNQNKEITVGVKTGETGGFGNELLQKIESKLLKDTPVSSETDALTSKIQEAITGVKTAETATEKRIASKFDREIELARRKGEETLTSVMVSRRGFATNNALIRQIKDDTERSVRDLEQRKQELILAGEAEAASQVAALQIQEIKFGIESKQRAFSNMMRVGELGLGIAAEKRAETFAQRSEARALRNENLAQDRFSFEKAQFEFDKLMRAGAAERDQNRIDLAKAEKKYQDSIEKVTAKDQIDFAQNQIDTAVDKEEAKKFAEEQIKEIRAAMASGTMTPAAASEAIQEIRDYVKLKFPEPASTSLIEEFKRQGQTTPQAIFSTFEAVREGAPQAAGDIMKSFRELLGLDKFEKKMDEAIRKLKTK